MFFCQFNFLKKALRAFPVLAELKSGLIFSSGSLRAAPMAVVGTVFFFLDSSAANADLRLCNDTKNLVSVSLGYRKKSEWITEGWWRIPPDKCSWLMQGDLTSRFFYVYAEDADHKSEWRGDIFMCTDNRKFRIEGIRECYVRGYQKTGFFEVDTGNKSNWMIRLTETGQTESVR